MIQLENGNKLVETAAELPDFTSATDLYLDVETNSFDPKEMALYPYLGHRIAGIAVTADDCETAYYLPIRHPDGNIPLDAVQQWLIDHMTNCKRWVNQNVKFDAHFVKQDGADVSIYGNCPGIELVDTLVLSKLEDSDRMTYGLKELSHEWLGYDLVEQDRLKGYLKGIGSKNFGDVPADICGDYACMDVQMNRHLMKYLVERRPTDVGRVWKTEIALTATLFDMECFGMRVYPLEVEKERAKSLMKQIQGGSRLYELCEEEVNVNSNKQLFDLFVNQLGLPILAYTDSKENPDGSVSGGNPAFGKEALGLYKTHPMVMGSDKLMEIVTEIKEQRDEAHFFSLFLESYKKLNVDGVLHPEFNQIIRTGRMSSRRPNAQQLNARAKRLIHPPEGHGILSNDYSQVEFRLIVHYIRDIEAINAYNEDPLTDFHQWIADVCGVKRKAAKCLNFGMGFGASEKRVVQMLVSNPDVIEESSELINQRVAAGTIEEADRNDAFKAMCYNRAKQAYATYHERLPGIKATSQRATQTARQRGFVFNQYGRRRHIPTKFCYKAFNSVIQSCAADLMKERLVFVSPRYNSWTRENEINPFAAVHDEIACIAPLEVCRDVAKRETLRKMYEQTSEEFLVPIVMSGGFSDRDWAEASGDDVRSDANGNYLAGPWTA